MADSILPISSDCIKQLCFRWLTDFTVLVLRLVSTRQFSSIGVTIGPFLCQLADRLSSLGLGASLTFHNFISLPAGVESIFIPNCTDQPVFLRSLVFLRT